MGSDRIERKQKEPYHVRRKRIAMTLQGFGLSLGRSKRMVYRYPLHLLETLIEETLLRNPVAPDEYFLRGLQRSRIQYGDYRKRDRKKKKKRMLLVSQELSEGGGDAGTR